MFLSKFFRNVRAKALVALAGVTMVLGVGAAISAGVAQKDNEVVETKAGSTNAACIVMWAKDEIGWTGWSNALYIKFNSVQFKSSFAYKDESLGTVIEDYDTSTGITTDGANYYRTMDWDGSDGQSYIWYVPWYIQSFNYNIGRTNSSDICQGQGGTTNWAQASSGQFRKDYIYKANNQPYYSTGTTSGGTATISTTTYSLSFNTNDGSSISPATYKEFEATSAPASNPTKTGYTFVKWTETNSASAEAYSFGSCLAADKTIYAQWTVTTYDITFYQNDGSGITVTKSKTYNVTYTVPSLATLGMSASTGRCFLRWDTDEHGEGTPYSEGSPYTTNAALDLYMIQDWYRYEYSQDGGTNWIAIDNLLKIPTSGYIGELVTSSTHALTSGNSLIFRKYYGSGSHTNVTIHSFSGNYSGGAIKYSYTGNVAVRVASNGDLDVNVDGDGTRQIFVNSTPYGLYFSGYDGYTVVPVTLYPNDVIRGGWQGESYASTLAAGDGDFSIVNGDVTCHAPGVFTIHLVTNDEGKTYPSVRFVMDASGSAILFAQTFSAAISAVCTGITGGTKTVATDLVNAWGTNEVGEETGQCKNYASLTDDAQELLVEDDSGSDIDLYVKMYKYVCGKYGPNGTGDLDDFMGLNPSRPSSSSVIPNSTKDQSPLTTTLWIVLASGLAGLAAIGTAYFVSKKKKRPQA